MLCLSYEATKRAPFPVLGTNNMEDTTINLGPESPADLEWSQGAKNPRKETNDGKFDLLEIGTLLSDTDEDKDDDFPLVLKEATETSRDDICRDNDDFHHDDAIGTPSGDTVAKSDKQMSNFKRPKSIGDEQRNKAKRPRIDEKPIPELGDRSWEKHDKPAWRKIKSVDQQLYENYLERLRNLEFNAQGETETRNFFVNEIKKKYTAYEKFKKNPLCAIICTLQDDGSFTDKQLTLLKSTLIDLLTDYCKQHRGEVIRFEECNIVDGVLLLRATDDYAIRWLKTLALKKLAKSEYKNTRIDRAVILTHIDLAELVPASVTLSPVFHRKDFDWDFLKLIVFQNRDVDVRRWVFMRKEVGSTKEVWHMKIDTVSLRLIKSREWRLYCGAGQVTFKCNVPFS